MGRTKKRKCLRLQAAGAAKAAAAAAAAANSFTSIALEALPEVSLAAARSVKRSRLAASTDSEQPAVLVEHDWDQLSAELRCHLLLFLNAGDVVKMALMSSRWTAAVYMHLRTRTVLSFSDGPCGAVPRGLNDTILHKLLGRCPRLRFIYGFHLSHQLQQDDGLDGSGPCGSTTVISKGDCQLTAVGVTRSIQQCRQLEGIEISDVLLLQAVPQALPKVQLLRGFCNRHGHLPVGKTSVLLTLPPDVFTTSIELYDVTVPELPSLRHIRRLHLQRVILTEPQPFENCCFPELESFAMKFCTAPQLERQPDTLIDDFGIVHVEMRGYRLLFEALANAARLQSIELVDLHFPHTGTAIWDIVAENGGFKNLRRFTIGNCPGAMTEDIGMVVISSSSRLEELQLQPRGCGEALLLALVASGCVFPSLTRLHLGYSENWPSHSAAGNPAERGAYARSGRFCFVSQVNRFWDRTTQLTDHCLRRILASPMLPSLGALTICASPHLVDAQLWITPVKAQLTELTLNSCLSLRRRDLEKAIELMTQLRYLRLERVFRSSPKECDHVDLTVQSKRTGISLLGPYAIDFKWSGGTRLARLPPQSADEPAAACGLRRCGTQHAQAAGIPAQAGGSTYRASHSVLAGDEDEHTARLTSAAADATKGLASGYTCLHCCCLPRACGQTTPGPAASGGLDAGTTSAAVGSACRPSVGQRQRPAPLGPRCCGDDSNGASEWSDDGGCWDSASDWSDGVSWGSSEWSDGSSSSCWDSSADDDSLADGVTGASSGSRAPAVGANDGDAGRIVSQKDDAGNRDADGSHSPRACEAVGASEPVPEWDRTVVFFIRSPSLVTLSLDRVDVTAVALEDCSRLDSVAVTDCPSLTAFEFGPPLRYSSQEQPSDWGTLSRITFLSCPKLWSGPVVHWSLVQPLPPPNRLLTSHGTSLRMRVLTANWDRPVQRVSDLVSLAEECLPHMPDDYESAFVVVEEQSHWSDTRRRLHVENVLSGLLSPAVEVLDADRLDQLSPQSVTGSEHSDPWHRRRRCCGRVEVPAPKVACADGEDRAGHNTPRLHVDGPVRVRFVHNLPPCLACGHRIDLWGAEYRRTRPGTACTCQPRPVLAAPLRVITCAYLYAASQVPTRPCLDLDDPDARSHGHSQPC